MFILDTNVLSHIAPARRKSADDKLAEWIVARSSDLWLSVVTAAEIEDGITKAARTGATKKAEHLTEWWGEIRHYYAERILSVDLEVAQEAGRLMDRARAAGISAGFEDIAIAATGSVHSLVVLTRNAKDFDALRVRYQNPFDVLPD
jgi:predicted nucleic acid-binding protein